MRVSKVVREYIEKQVCAKYPKTENEIAYSKLVDSVNTANQEYEQLMEQASKEIANKLMAKYGFNKKVYREKRYSYLPFDTWGTQERQTSDIDQQNRRVAIRNKIEDIIVNLELGGTKADLEKMLSEI